MKDSLLLLLTASYASIVAWSFWHSAGQNGFDLLAILVMTTLFADNVRLRRKLKKGENRA
ncbi:MAG: hypothetical protein A2075_00725 [Geobacteraceae bacterium GWC2_58_44]|nr:MAG: hypothetical protein A2075_00725 [Geobacteraceae bacterium GWC2_58_44]HBG06218.1 hypothetical protein [Geobacter sp.]